MYEREVKDYCRRAGSLLACGRAQRQRFDRLTRQSVQEYLQEVPGASWPEVEQTLGSPEEAAGAFMESLPPGAACGWRPPLAVWFLRCWWALWCSIL